MESTKTIVAFLVTIGLGIIGGDALDPLNLDDTTVRKTITEECTVTREITNNKHIEIIKKEL